MLTLAGYPLVSDDNEYAEVDKCLRRYLPLHSFCPWLAPDTPTAGLAMLTNSIGQHIYQEPRLGKFIWPTGASRFGYGHFLCDSDTTQLIMSYAYNPDGSYNLIPFNLGNPESNQSGTIVSGEVINANVFLLPVTPLSGIRGLSVSGQFSPSGNPTSANSLYLLTIVDQRYFWWYYNVGDLTTQITSSTTWSSLINQLLAIVNVNVPPFTVNLDTISSNYLGVSANMFTLPYEPVAPVLDALFKNIGHRMVLSYDGTMVSSQLYQTALDALNMDMSTTNGMNRVVIAGGQRLANPM